MVPEAGGHEPGMKFTISSPAGRFMRREDSKRRAPRLLAVLLTLPTLAMALPFMANATTYLVRPDGTGDFPTIQAAIDATHAGDVVELDDGIFTGPGNRDIVVPYRQLIIRSRSGHPASCILDCQELGFGIDVYAVAGTELQGFTITRGRNPWGGGAALSISSGSGVGITVSDCVFSASSCAWGGAVGSVGNSTFHRCHFIDNHAYEGGAFATNSAYGPTFDSCEFIGNSATHCGGAVFFETIEVARRDVRNAVFRDCLFAQNTDHPVVLDGASPTFESCTFVGNSSTGGVIGCSFALGVPSHPSIRNCIIAFSPAGRAVICDAQSEPALECCDLFGNAGGDWVGCLDGQLGTDGNIAEDPLFCDPAGFDFTIEEGSPCAPNFNPACGLIGAFSVGCGSTPTRSVSWGAAKAMFR